MKNKKLWAALLAAAMMMTVMGSVASADDREKEDIMYTEGLPIVDAGDYSFSLFVDGGSSDTVPTMFPILEEQTGVSVELQTYSYEIAQEKYALALSSGDYADCIGGWCLSAKDILNYGVDMGVFIPLEDYFEKYCPRISEILELEGVREAMTAPDGHIYSIPYVIEAPEVDFSPYINKKWLENVGMEMPTTTEELREVLRAFKEQDANGNGDPNDEIPLSGSPDNLHLGYLAGYFGCSINENGFTMDGDQLVFGATSEAYKKGMEYLASLYAEGLIDPELFTQDGATWKSKGGQDLYGVCIMYGYGDIVQQDVTVMPDWTPLPVLKSEGVENPVWQKDTYGTTVLKNQVVITDNAEHPEVICRWWDNFFELDNSVMSQNGVLDEVLFKQEDGSYTKIDVTKESQEVQERNDWGNLWPQALPKYIPEGFKIKEEVEPVYNETDYRDSLYEPYLTEKCVPDEWPDLEHSEEIAELAASIKDYITQCQAKWVAGQSDINADWDGYLEQLDKLGLEKYLEYKDAVKGE